MKHDARHAVTGQRTTQAGVLAGAIRWSNGWKDQKTYYASDGGFTLGSNYNASPEEVPTPTETRPYTTTTTEHFHTTTEGVRVFAVEHRSTP